MIHTPFNVHKQVQRRNISFEPKKHTHTHTNAITTTTLMTEKKYRTNELRWKSSLKFIWDFGHLIYLFWLEK